MSEASLPESAANEPARPLVVRIVHASPGRIRAKVPREAFDSPLLRQAEDALLAVDGVQSVRRNPTASSVLVTYDPAVATVPALLAALTNTNVTIVAPADGAAVGAAEAGGRSQVAQWLAAPFRKTDQTIAATTHGGIDLKTMIPIGLGILAAREVLSGRVHMAPWYNLTWWAFDSYLKLQRNEPPPRPRDE
ncbi:MAG TPA: hypothetical protein VII06_34935 [Chloroflexota bacterium]